MILFKKEKFFILSYFICCILILFRLEILFGSDVEAPFADDFYYYLIPVKNFLKYGFPTFDTLNITNGFQPLWFLIILLINFFFENDLLINLTVIILIFLFSFLTFCNFNKFLKTENFSNLEALFISSFISYLTLFFSRNGMEISCAIFFLSFSLIFYKKNNLLFSFFSFLSIMSRLDIIFIFFLLGLNQFNQNQNKFEFLLKFLPFPLLLIFFYLIINIYFFGYPFPESGLAKSLYIEFKFNLETFSFIEKKSLGFIFIKLLFFINIIGFFFIFSKKSNFFTKLFLISAIIFFIQNSLRSPWPLWNWHFYYLAISTPFIVIDITKTLTKITFYKNINFILNLFFVFTFTFLFFRDLNMNNDLLINLSKGISKYYSTKNSKIFAIGDMGGKISYLLDKPVIQLEGLVSGRKMIRNINDEKNLCTVLRENSVDVYFASKIWKINNFYIINEPSIESKNIKRMKGKIIGEPEKVFKSGPVKIYAFNFKENSSCIE